MSVDLESTLNLQADAEAVVALVQSRGGRLITDDTDDGTYWLQLSPRSAPPEVFVIRIIWTAYPGMPPSVKFAIAIGGAVDDSRAWPLIPGYRPDSLDICMPFTAEGFAIHPEWTSSSDAWPTSGNPFLWVAHRLAWDLDHRYQGRHQ